MVGFHNEWGDDEYLKKFIQVVKIPITEIWDEVYQEGLVDRRDSSQLPNYA